MNQEILLRQFEDIGIPDSAEEFTFPETAFITVTAYQNQQVDTIKLKSMFQLNIFKIGIALLHFNLPSNSYESI